MMTDLVEHTVQQTRRMLMNGEAQHKILDCLVHTAESVAGNDSVSSILFLDRHGLLRNASSPRLPYDYLTAIDGLRPNAQVGTCAAAAASGLMVITPDFRADNKWAELRHLPLALGFVGAWSMPIKNNHGKVLGTFGTYFREKREPSQREIDCVNSLTAVAASVLAAN